MKVHFDYRNYNVPHPVITTGIFDGVHTGHVKIINRLNKVAGEKDGNSVVVTFWPHPRVVLQQKISLKLLNTLDERLHLLEMRGVQHVVVIPFTAEFSRLSSKDFINNILVDKLKVNHLIVGYNHHFGKDREGDFKVMKNYAKQFQFTVEKIDAETIENKRVSATLIRNILTEGKVEEARKFLGYDYMLSGTVTEGNKIGNSIGFPTANLHINDDLKCIPRKGVYAVEVEAAGQRLPGMLNIGYRPTISNNLDKLSIEVHMINFSGNIYGHNITLHFKQWVRDEVKFDNIEALSQQLNLDKLKIMKILGL